MQNMTTHDINQEPSGVSKAAEDATDPSQGNKDILEVTEMEMAQSPEQAATGELAEMTPKIEVEVPMSAEFEKLWKLVQENPEEFSSWTYLLQYVEQENNIPAARKAFDAFLSRYPYCYGYWKKYADIEKKRNNILEADEVFRRGIQAITLSVDLWISYLNFLKETLDPADPETGITLRGTFEHAVMSAGLDFRSDKLWEMYANWETEQGNLSGVTSIYSRLLGIPTQYYSNHFQKFKDHIQNNLPRSFLTDEKFLELRKELATVNVHCGSDIPSGLEEITDPAKRTTEIENMRHRIIEVHQELFSLNEHEVTKRWSFEEGIKRPYFHVKPLEKAQLNNWREYLDYEIENGSHERIVILFERCVIACAHYEEFWIKYAKYMEKHSVEGVRHVYNRACIIHLLRKPQAHVLWAAFEEQHGFCIWASVRDVEIVSPDSRACTVSDRNNVDEARRILKTLEDLVGDLAMIRLRRVNLERRHGNLKEAENLFTQAMKYAKSNVEYSFYAVKLARHLFKVQKDVEKARTVLSDAIARDQDNAKLYLNVLEMEFNGDLRQNEANILSTFDRAIKSSMPLGTRIKFSQRKVEFLEDFGYDINRLLVTYDEHQKLLKEQEAQKRKAENGLEQPDAKRAHTEESTAVSAASLVPQAAPGGYNYANWYQYNYQNYPNTWNYGQYYNPPST